MKIQTIVLASIVSFAPAKARYFRFNARHCLEMNHAIVAEIGVIE